MPDYGTPQFPMEGSEENLFRNQSNVAFERILNASEWSVQFQPIFSFFTGEIYGYRVNYDIRSLSPGLTSSELFRYAASEGKLTRLQRILWDHVLSQWKQCDASCFLFLPISVSVVEDVAFTIALMEDHLNKAGLSPRQIVLDITDTVPCQIDDVVNERIQEFRRNRYKVAVGNIGNGYSWIENILSFRPDYVNVDPLLVTNIHKNDIQIKVLEIVLDLAQRLHFQVIAKGIGNVDDLQILLRMGSQFGQGPLLEQPSPMKEGMFEGTHLIQEWLSQRGHGAPKRGRDLGSITRPVKTVEKQTPVAEVVRYFNEFEMETGVVVVQDEEPIGLVMRESLFRRLAFKYGYSLYWHREIAKLMDKDPLILEADTALETASRLSMARHRDQIYDLVIVTRRGKLIGAVTIRDMLNVITQEHMELARDANPLTGLPGNRRIEREIEQRIEADQPFTIIYVDLDHFKWFNDQYGFHRGDSVIVFTANVLRDCLERLGEPGDFVGHIGGDDFILITQTSDLNALCEAIISRFDHEVPQFYSHPSGNPEAHIVTDRWGNPVGSTGIAISLSVLECHDVKRSELSLERIAEEAGHLKKMAKSIQGSTSVRGSLGST